MKYTRRIGQKTGMSMRVNENTSDSDIAVKLRIQNFFSESRLMNGLYSAPVASGSNGSPVLSALIGVRNEINWKSMYIPDV